MGLMKRLAGSSWGADARTLKTLYHGRVRPALEYGISAWSTTAKTNFNKICRVQNQASRIITGGMKSTPIQMLESTAQLQPMEERRDMKTAIHYEKIKRMTGHHLYPRAHALSRGRIKRESMIRRAKDLVQAIPTLVDSHAVELRQADSAPWYDRPQVNINEDIPGLVEKDQQSPLVRRSIAVE